VAALAGGEGREAVAALLALDSELEARVRSGEDSTDLDNARSTFRALIARLGEAAVAGISDPREAVAPYVDALLEVRSRARAARDFGTADVVRDRLIAVGVEVRDGAEGSTWSLGDRPA
jgi:cysteinyl-tRNA synthetase